MRNKNEINKILFSGTWPPKVEPLRNPDGSVNPAYFKRDEALRQRLIERLEQPPGQAAYDAATKSLEEYFKKNGF